MFKYVVQYIFLFCILNLFGVNSQNTVVEIPQGSLRGSTRTNRDGGTYYSFQSIPYATPPIGELRFKAPQPADNWNGVRDATTDLPACIQLGSDPTNIEGEEDCLYLNIYTPSLPNENGTEKPVMVFIYGGFFTDGSAQEFNYGAEFLLTKDVVLVVVNYRVGIYGFLSLDDPNLGVTGNAGLKDQVLALKWIQDNIEYFGGDPNNVLLFGESAGSMSVHLHMLSPLSEGLFHKAICQSGVSLTNLGTMSLRNSGRILAETLGIQTENWDEMLQSLQNLSTDALSVAEMILTLQYEYFSSPVIEISSTTQTFLTQYPIDIIKSGIYNQVPFIIGFNDVEGLLFEQMAVALTGESILIDDFSHFIPEDLNILVGSEEEARLAQQIKEFYYGDEEPSRDNITGAVNLYTDFGFAFPAYRVVLEQIKNALHPIYFYYFAADTRLNSLKSQYDSIASYPGAAHADELGYIFHSSITPTDIEEGSVEDLGIKNMVNLWTNFAIYGNPTLEENLNNLEWRPVQDNQIYFLYIGTNETYLDINPETERMQFWLGLYEEYLPSY